jgi:predicted esterase
LSESSALHPDCRYVYFVYVHRPSLTIVFAVLLSSLALAEGTPSSLPAGTIIPKVVCGSDNKQSYALYLPSNFSAARAWPIIYVFDPAARGQMAVETIRAAAEKFGYIVAASNNSHNGAMGDSAEAAKAMWQDTQQRFPVAEQRRYLAGMSGGARVATGIALACHNCAAGVIANAAGFPPGSEPKPDMKFAYYAAVGNADFNYAEFVDLRRQLDQAGTRYHIRIFEGQHGWAPPEVWMEALNWMDIQAMSAGTLPRDDFRIQQTLASELASAHEFQSQNNPLAALRQYQSVVRDLRGLADTSAAETAVAELSKSKAVKVAEKEEASALAQQVQMTSGLYTQMQAISGDREKVDVGDLKSSIIELKKRATDSRNSNDLKALVAWRALGGLVVAAYEGGQRCLEEKNYRAALAYFDLAAAGSANPAWAHYQRARAYAMLTDKKNTLVELKTSLAGGFHESSALDASEFQNFRGQPEFQALAEEWKVAADKEKVQP